MAPGYIAVTGLAAAQKVKLTQIIPSEGAASYVDAWAIPPKGPDRDGVLEWINQTLTPKVQAYQSESLLQGVVQPSALQGSLTVLAQALPV